MYKNNSRDRSKIKGCSPLQLSCNLTGKLPAVGYYSYTSRYQQFNKYEIYEQASLKINYSLKLNGADAGQS